MCVTIPDVAEAGVAARLASMPFYADGKLSPFEVCAPHEVTPEHRLRGSASWHVVVALPNGIDNDQSKTAIFATVVASEPGLIATSSCTLWVDNVHRISILRGDHNFPGSIIK